MRRALADPTHPCKGAIPRRHSHFVTSDGQFGSRDENGNQVDEGTFDIIDVNTLVVPFGYDLQPVGVAAATTIRDSEAALETYSVMCPALVVGLLVLLVGCGDDAGQEKAVMASTRKQGRPDDLGVDLARWHTGLLIRAVLLQRWSDDRAVLSSRHSVARARARRVWGQLSVAAAAGHRRAGRRASRTDAPRKRLDSWRV